MKTTTVFIEFKIPAEYKYMAQHSWGEWTAFKRKPVLVKATEYTDDDVYYWGKQDDELDLCNPGIPNDNWKSSVVQLKTSLKTKEPRRGWTAPTTESWLARERLKQ